MSESDRHESDAVSKDPAGAASLLSVLSEMEQTLRRDGDTATADAIAVLSEDVAGLVRELREDHAAFRESCEALLSDRQDRLLFASTTVRKRQLALEQALAALGLSEVTVRTHEALDSMLSESVLTMSDASEVSSPKAPSGKAAESEHANDPAPADKGLQDLAAYYGDPGMAKRLAGVDILRVQIEQSASRLSGVYIDVKDGGWVADTGGDIRLGAPRSDAALAQEIATLVAIAHAKGWSTVKLDGSEAFVQQASLALEASGITTKCGSNAKSRTSPAHGPSL